jgi:hypothetical protein
LLLSDLGVNLFEIGIPASAGTLTVEVFVVFGGHVASPQKGISSSGNAATIFCAFVRRAADLGSGVAVAGRYRFTTALTLPALLV